ncbi:MAG TPA: L,D-transpeptidase family protein [Streptosporangiaceae bacterium]|nr:L,D-transpeptidase family protein [Streptosporangiaceae bacterium]
MDGFGSGQKAGAHGDDDVAGTADAAAASEGSVAAGGSAGSGSWISNIMGNTRRRSWAIATAAAAAAVVVIALGIVAASSGPVASHKASYDTKKKVARPVTVVAVSPGNGASGVNGTSPITVTYSGAITKSTPLPTLSPSIAGSWQVSGDKATFTPQVGFTEDTHVTVNIPASAGTTTTAATSFKFTTGHYSVVRLDQLLSQLGYIPVTWTPTDSSGDIPATDASAQLAAAYDPPAGTFAVDSGYPRALTSQWSAGTDNAIIEGAVRTFEYDHGLTMDGDAGRKVWSHLFTAIAKDERNQHGYTYVWVTQAGTEHLVLYHNGRVAIRSVANTGIAASPTADGTFPVYLRYQVTQMQGTNPDGTPYDDTVYWVSYFNGGDAVHAFPRASYGWYQSLGCVELPSYGSTAEDVWNLITYGTLVTVTGPVA